MADDSAGADGDHDMTIDLPRDVTAASIARREVRQALGEDVHGERLDALLLTTTELVTNAVVHGEGDIRLTLGVRGDRVRGEVIDGGGGFEHEIRERGPEDLDGRGLMLVAAVPDAWGVHEGTTHVWFELGVDNPDADPDLAPPKLGAEARPPDLG